jgi:ribosomal protein S6--L-glutamate ligase
MGIIYGEISTRHQLMMERAEDIFESVLCAPIDGLKFVHGEETKIIYKGTDLTEFDAVYIRTSDRDQYFAEHLSEMLNEAGVVTQAQNDTYAYESNKFYSMKLLADNGVRVPDSVYTLSPDTAIDAARRLGYPVILKTAEGGGGEGLMRVSSENELRPIMDAMKSFEQDIVLQEYIEHEGTDNRVYVIGDLVTSVRRSSSGDEWRSNVSGGGEYIEGDLTEEMKDVSLIAARATGFDMCGVDVIEVDDEPIIIEINGSFGIRDEINELVGEDLILRMVERMHRQAMEKEKED